MDIQSIIILLLILYLLFCYWKKKRITDLCLVAILLVVQLPSAPFFVPRAYCNSGLAIIMAGMTLYDFTKAKNRKFVVYALVFLYFAIIFLIPKAGE